MRFHRTRKRQLLAVWEAGGGYGGLLGEASLVCGPHGEPLQSIFVNMKKPHTKRVSNLACGTHEMFKVYVGAYGITHKYSKDFEIVTVERVVSIKGSGEAEVVHTKKNGRWDSFPPDMLRHAIKAAEEKATCKNCTRPHWLRWESYKDLCSRARVIRQWLPKDNPPAQGKAPFASKKDRVKVDSFATIREGEDEHAYKDVAA